MRFPLHLVIEYAHTKPSEIDRAYVEFFGNRRPETIDNEDVKALYFEWLIFDYRQTSGPTFLIEYVLRNPDNLSSAEHNRFQQIVKTHHYSEFQIVSVVRGSYIEVEDVFSNTKYEIYDTAGSQNSEGKGILKARIAQVDNRWYLVGANPIFIPIEYTPRLKKVLREEFHISQASVKDTTEILLQREKNPPKPPKILTNQELVIKRKEIERTYEIKAKQYAVTLSFQNLIQRIYEENRVNVLDFWQELTKVGLTEKFIVKEFSILQDSWNYFPHIALDGLSPIEAYGKLKRPTK